MVLKNGRGARLEARLKAIRGENDSETAPQGLFFLCAPHRPKSVRKGAPQGVFSDSAGSISEADSGHHGKTSCMDHFHASGLASRDAYTFTGLRHQYLKLVECPYGLGILADMKAVLRSREPQVCETVIRVQNLPMA